MNRLIHTLGNGLRVVTEKSSGHVAYIGLLINAGSRDDSPGRDGLAHFVEHTIFKGTTTRNGFHVSNRMESVGGELNAYTTKEEIMLYTNAPAGFEERAIQLLADLAANACFPEEETVRERGVILEEINSYRDDASSAVFDEFDEFFFKGSGLAHNILGYAGTVDKMSNSDASGFLQHYFAPANMVMYCVAPSDPEKNLQLIERYFGPLSRRMPVHERPVPAVNPHFIETRDRNNHQANVLMGTRAFSHDDDRRYALFLMSNLLGGPAMNSRLNRELRELRGLVYTVESNVALYSNAGAFQIYFACEPENAERCIRIITRELEKLTGNGLTERQFTMARRQMCGQLLVSGDNRESCAMSLAKSLMRHGEVHDNAYTAERIMQLKQSDVRDVARMIVNSPMSRFTIT